MPSNIGGQLEEIGWRIEIDGEEEELLLEHFETGNTFIFDAEGNLTVPGDGDIGGDLRELQTLLSSALEGEDDDQSLEDCSIDCDGPISIESEQSITLDAPNIELSADASLTAETSGVMSLQGGLLKLN